MMMIFDAAGVLGAALIVLAYALLQAEKLKAEGAGFAALNLTGALLIILSLTASWNLSAFLLEAAWACISLRGLHRALRAGRTPG